MFTVTGGKEEEGRKEARRRPGPRRRELEA